MDWFPAYFFMATAFFQVFEYSLLGTIIEIAVKIYFTSLYTLQRTKESKTSSSFWILQNDNIYNAICNISFNYLPIAEQKKVVFMTLIAQHPHTLTIGGFERLNVETFIQVSAIFHCLSRNENRKCFVLGFENHLLSWYAIGQHDTVNTFSTKNGRCNRYSRRKH